jgi:hypothetical protein
MIIADCSKELGVVNMAISDEAIDELLGNANIKTQDDLFGKDGILK